MDPTRAEPRGRRDLSDRQPRLMGFDHGPDPLPLGFFEPFRGEAQPGCKPLFAPDPLSDSSFVSTPLDWHRPGSCPANWTA